MMSPLGHLSNGFESAIIVKTLLASLLFGLLLITPFASANADIRQQPIQFKPGASSTRLKGTIKGDQTVDYQLRAGRGNR